MMFVPLLDREFIEIEEGLCAVMSRYRLLVAMNIIRKVPVSIVVLFTQAICIYGCVHRPRVDVHKRKIFINDLYLVAVLLQQPGKKRGMHAGTERTLEIVIVHNGDFGVLVAAYRPSFHVNF